MYVLDKIIIIGILFNIYTHFSYWQKEMAESGAYKDEKSENSRPNENSDHSDIEVT